MSTMKFFAVLAMLCQLTFTSALLKSSPFTKYSNSVQQRSSVGALNAVKYNPAWSATSTCKSLRPLSNNHVRQQLFILLFSFRTINITSKALGKGDIADILKEKTGFSKKDIESMLTAFAEAVQQEVLLYHIERNESRLHLPFEECSFES